MEKKCTVINHHNLLSVCIGSEVYNIHPEQQKRTKIGEVVDVSITLFCNCENDMDYEYMDTRCPHFHPNAITECTNKVAVIGGSDAIV